MRSGHDFKKRYSLDEGSSKNNLVENSVDVHGSTGLTKLDRLSAAQLYLQLRSQNCEADNSYNTIISISVAFIEIMWYLFLCFDVNLYFLKR